MPTEKLREVSGWYALYTRHQHEKNIAKALTAKGFEVFLPLYASTHQWRGRIKHTSLPFFPCYVFLQAPPDGWLPILTTPGIHTVVGFAGQPAVIPPSEIEAIRRVVESPMKAEPHPFLQCGDRVRLIAGPLEGLEGALIRKNNVWKLLVSVELLQRSVAVEVDAYMVERIGVPKPSSAQALVDSSQSSVVPVEIIRRSPDLRADGDGVQPV
jgi:transcription antitermination factor NusG